jgi:NADH-quinone oxidoreductase subunit G
LAGNVVDLCPVGALLDKNFLFKQRVWFLTATPSISPVDAGGENIWIDHNEGAVYRIRPRANLDVNKWWISDDTRYAWKGIQGENRLRSARKAQFGTQVEVTYQVAMESAGMELRALASTPGSLYAQLSPMMTTEEAYLLATYIRSLDPQAVLILGPVPTQKDEVFSSAVTGKQTYTIKGEKVPNAAGVRRVIEKLGGPKATYEEFIKSESAELKKLKGGWVVGGYLKDWVGKEQPPLYKKGYRVVQDILPNSLVNAAEVVLPAAAWCEKEGCWENFARKVQVFAKAVNPPEGVTEEGSVYAKLLKRPLRLTEIRATLGEPYAGATIPATPLQEPATEFVEL